MNPRFFNQFVALEQQMTKSECMWFQVQRWRSRSRPCMQAVNLTFGWRLTIGGEEENGYKNERTVE